MTTHALTVAQAGAFAFSTWIDGTSDEFILNTRVGLRFTKGNTRKIWSSPTLTLTYVSGTGGAGTLTVYGVKRINAAEWSDSNTPNPTATPHPLETLYSGTVTLDLSNPTASVALATHADSGATNFFGAWLSADALDTRHLGLIVNWTGTTCFAGVELSSTIRRDLTGIVSARPAMSRADECPRCGTEMFREAFQLDGETNTLVCASCYDPPSPPRGPGVKLTEVNP